MPPEKELTEYHSLCAALASLHERFLSRRQELRLLLEETAEMRMNVLQVLAGANRLTRHLTGCQRQRSGLTYFLGDIKARINQCGQARRFGGTGIEEADELRALPGINSLNRAELRRNGIMILGLVDRVKKNLLRLDLLELRCRELVLSLKKALEAFCFEWGRIRRNIFPYGIFSLLYRSLRRLCGSTYFSFRDMDDIAALGAMTGMVMKLADSPLVKNL